ncbi:uncharacterized protein DSM5745_09262 [Aspergillus mulundensis]|uniref:LysM domain-containing protein n=1 Tax=Aspergillus mulundensis TaxID=1810919 RepID=A0A3D8R024_9EURO|nr:hypothetical protein DSM5745_09262 [Aspergillus mulundensis]RDW67396.1 hypothetical protein DSM5745_09262 [Aspergillus mulundensis]
MSISLCLLGLFPAAFGATMLMNGLQSRVFPSSMPTSCMAAFNASLDCDSSVQYLYKQHGWVEGGWQESNLTRLCTDSCRSSLQSLRTQVDAACASWSTTADGLAVSASGMVDFYLYKYNVTCLTDGSSFCLLEQDDWTLQALEAKGNDPEYGTNAVDENGTVILPYQDPPPANVEYSVNLGYASLDYWYNRTEPLTDRGWTNTSILEYDEYPLEIQCSTCFLERFKLGFSSQFGEGYDDVTEQVWHNMQQNCKLDEELYVHPNLNETGPWDADRPEIIWTVEAPCDRTTTLSIAPGEMVTCQDLGLAESVPSSSIPSLNYDAKCDIPLSNGTYCLPEPCDIAVIANDTSAPILLQSETYQNITMVQFVSWNPDVDLKNLFMGDTICVGRVEPVSALLSVQTVNMSSPPGGIYTPSSTTVGAAYPTSFTTTASPSAPTATDTIANCGLYYTVQQGDICDDVTLRFSLTLAQLIAMNPSIDEECSNLLYGEHCTVATEGLAYMSCGTGFDYCVAPVHGPVTSTAIPTTTTSDGGGTTTSTTVTAPTETRTGTTETCYEWYIAVAGDSCWLIYTKYGITFAQFRQWNAVIDDECSNLWPDYAYCVSGPKYR